MSKILGIGSTDTWARIFVSPKDVYIWRATLGGLPLARPEQALELVRAVGVGQNLGLDVRGIALRPLTPDNMAWAVDVVLTANWLGPLPGFFGMQDNAQDIADHVMADASLRAQFPTFGVTDPVLLQLTGPPGAIDHWLSQPVLWDRRLGSTGKGGPTDSFARPADYSIVQGTADDGAQAKAWVVPRPDIGPGPVGPPVGPGGPLGPGKGAQTGLDTVEWLLLASAVGAVAWWLTKKGRAR